MSSCGHVPAVDWPFSRLALQSASTQKLLITDFIAFSRFLAENAGEVDMETSLADLDMNLDTNFRLNLLWFSGVDFNEKALFAMSR